MDGIVTSVIYYLASASRVVFKGLGFLGLSGTNQSTILMMIFGAFVIFIIGFTLGRSRILMSIICVFIAFFVEKNFPYFASVSSLIGKMPAYIVHIGLFALAFVISFSILNRSVLKHRVTLKDASIISILILSLVNVGLLTSVVLSYYSGATFFGTKNALFYWAIVTLIAIFFLKGKREITSPISKSK